MRTALNAPAHPAPAPIATIRYRNGTAQRIYPTWVETDQPGSPTLVATSRLDQAETAERLGYGADIDAMTRDHDRTHAALCDWLGLPGSFSLKLAAGDAVDADLADAEEEAVMALQRFMRLAGVEWL